VVQVHEGLCLVGLNGVPAWAENTRVAVVPVRVKSNAVHRDGGTRAMFAGFLCGSVSCAMAVRRNHGSPPTAVWRSPRASTSPGVTRIPVAKRSATGRSQSSTLLAAAD